MDELGKAGLIKIAEFGVRSAVATDTMSTYVKLLRGTEESTSDLAGYGNPRCASCPFALLNCHWNGAGMLMQFGPLELLLRCGD